MITIGEPLDNLLYCGGAAAGTVDVGHQYGIASRMAAYHFSPFPIECVSMRNKNFIEILCAATEMYEGTIGHPQRIANIFITI